MRFLAAIFVLFTLFAALILYVDWRHSLVLDPRRASWRTIRNCKVICVSGLMAGLALLAWPAAASARPSQYPGVTHFVGDRYGSAQLGPEVARDVQRRRAGKAGRKRQRHLDVPLPRRRPGSVAPLEGNAEPLSVSGGAWREAGRVAARVIGGRPSGCPARFCGCGASLHLFGRIIPGLNLAANWLRFPRAAPAPKMVAARRGHVFVLERHIAGNTWLVHDSNSGGRRTRIHPRSISGYVIVNPHGA